MYLRKLLRSKLLRPATAFSGLAGYALAVAGGVARGATSFLRVGLVCVACPLGALQLAAAALALSFEMLAAALAAVALTLLLGRFFCGWLCTAGAAASEVLRVRKSGDWAVGAVLAVSAVAASFLFGIPVLCLVCPVGLPFKAVVALLYGSRAGWAVAAAAVAGFVGVALASRYLAYWCGSLCPVGAVLGLLGSKSVLRVKAAGKCTGCGVCARVCPAGLNPASMSWRERVACTLCLRCVGSCPMGSLKLGFAGGRRGVEGDRGI